MSRILPAFLLVILATCALQNDTHTSIPLDTDPTSATDPAICKCIGEEHPNLTNCAIVLNAADEVQEINSTKLVEIYQSSNETQQEQVSEIAERSQGNQTDVASKIQQMKRLVAYGQVVSHVAKLTAVQTSTHQKSQKIGTAEQVHDLDTNIQQLGPYVKLSPTNALEMLSHLPPSSNKHDRQLGDTFLTKTMVNGVLQDDNTSLAILGTRTGLQVHVSSQGQADAKQFDQASRMGQSIKTLGKLSGPVGYVEDTGLSIWSMKKSIERSSYHVQEANHDQLIEFIVGAIDTVIGVTFAAISFIFPPLTIPLLAAQLVISFMTFAGVFIFQAIDQAKKEVQRIHSQVPLTAAERKNLFENNFLGNRKPDYRHYLVEEKTANDLAVQNTLLFLERNPQFLGVVFPSRTLRVDGNCALWRRHCRARMAGGRCLAGQWESWIKLADKCEWNRACWGSQTCTDFTRDLSGRGRDHYECRCSGTVSNVFGLPRTNSLVDFRSQQQVFLERAVPSDVSNGVFQCKPGNKRYVDFKVSQPSSINGYLCENAIGLLQPTNKRKSGQILLFNLEDGSDTVYLSQRSISPPNMFAMGNDGTKSFEGNGGRNDFVFNSNCSRSLRGRFSGGISSDSIVLGDYCNRGQPITVDFKSGLIRSTNNNLYMSFSSIEELVGRESQKDTAIAACPTKKNFRERWRIIKFNGRNHHTRRFYMSIQPQRCSSKIHPNYQ